MVQIREVGFLVAINTSSLTKRMNTNSGIWNVRRAEHCYQAYQMCGFGTRWATFVDVCARFEDSIYADIVAEFNKLQQTGSISNY